MTKMAFRMNSNGASTPKIATGSKSEDTKLRVADQQKCAERDRPLPPISQIDIDVIDEEEPRGSELEIERYRRKYSHAPRPTGDTIIYNPHTKQWSLVNKSKLM